jgi:hypothetical protein
MVCLVWKISSTPICAAAEGQVIAANDAAVRSLKAATLWTFSMIPTQREELVPFTFPAD